MRQLGNTRGWFSLYKRKHEPFLKGNASYADVNKWIDILAAGGPKAGKLLASNAFASPTWEELLLSKFRPTPLGEEARLSHFKLLENVNYLAHGSYGAVLRGVVESGSKWRDEIEKQPVKFFYRELYPLVLKSLNEVAQYINVPVNEVSFVPVL